MYTYSVLDSPLPQNLGSRLGEPETLALIQWEPGLLNRTYNGPGIELTGGLMFGDICTDLHVILLK